MQSKPKYAIQVQQRYRKMLVREKGYIWVNKNENMYVSIENRTVFDSHAEALSQLDNYEEIVKIHE